VKASNVPQYEAGRKQKAAWHKQQNDPLPLLVWVTLSGENTGTFLVGHFNQHWADYDKPVVTDEADLAEFQKVLGNYVDSITTRYYDFMPKVSNESGDEALPKFSEITIYQVRYGKGSDFRSGIERVHEAAIKTKWPVNYGFYQLVNGGTSGTYVLSIPHKSWADFEDKPDVKPFRDMLKEAFGQAEADSIVDRFDRSIEKEIERDHPVSSGLELSAGQIDEVHDDRRLAHTVSHPSLLEGWDFRLRCHSWRLRRPSL
jgi:hypothetical protein